MAKTSRKSFLGHSVSQSKNVSEATSQKIDNEIRRLIDEAYLEAKRIITDMHSEFVAIAEGLLEYENADRRRDQGVDPRRKAGA